MANTFPTSLNDWAAGETIESSWADALETKIGIDGSADTNSLDYKVAQRVIGPASATDAVPVLFDGTTGKLIKNSTPTGTGNPVLATTPTLTTPVLGVATATSINKVAITAPATSSTLTIADGKTLTASNTLTLAGTDSTVMTFPSTSATIARTDAANTFTGVQTMTSPVINTSLELGHATENTLTASSGVLSIEGVVIPTISSTNTLTNKRVTPRMGSTTSSATPTINTDDYDAYSITAQAADITSFTTNLSGTPTNFQKLIIRIKDDGTARAITWGASFEAKGVALPTTTVISKVLTVGFIYDTVTSKWGCVASAQEA